MNTFSPPLVLPPNKSHSSKVDHQNIKLSEYLELQKDKDLYELCQHLSRENKLLLKENLELKKQLQFSKSESAQQGLTSCQFQDYRTANYDSYKKKAMQLLSSVKHLYGLYCQKIQINQVNNALDCIMAKISQGQDNIIIELVRMFDEGMKRADRRGWNIDQIIREADNYQVSLLRKHIEKMYGLLRQTTYQLKRDIGHVQQEVNLVREKISDEVHHYCQKYLNFSNLTDQQCPSNLNTQSQQSHAKRKKSTKQSQVNNQNVHIKKSGWSQVVSSKMKQQNKSKVEIKAKDKNKQSMKEDSRLNYYSLPLSKQASKPPKPRQISTKHQITIADQIPAFNPNIKSTPKNRKSGSSLLKESSYQVNLKKQSTPNWNSSNNSGRKYYYR